MPNGQIQIWSEIPVFRQEYAGLKKVNIKAHTTSRLYGARLCIIQYVKYNIQYIPVCTSTYWYVQVCTQLSHDFCHFSAILLYLHLPQCALACATCWCMIAINRVFHNMLMTFVSVYTSTYMYILIQKYQ
jgi:hypothetical protein